MGQIKLLDQSTINQIAAGEVIDRPSSIVKELMENAIDAGATIVTVEIKDGGCSLIRITDNGEGIAKEDIPTAFLRHSTSKIKNFEDLVSVSSLGFRGEALSSIAAVCQVELITKTADSLTGCRYLIEGGKEIKSEEIGAPNGTTFLVRNIFYNTPARRKFLKTPQTEAGYISAIIEQIALSHPEVSVRFISNNQPKIHTPGNGNLKDVIYNIYGRDVANNLIEVDATCDFVSVYGYIGKPVLTRGNRNCENYFINGRYIKSTIISKAIEEAYKPFLMQHKYPFTTLHISIAQELLDVNVHPAKMELRFRNGSDLYEYLIEVISESLREKPLIPEVSVEREKAEVNNILKRNEERQAEPFEINRIKQMQDMLDVSNESIRIEKNTNRMIETIAPAIVSENTEDSYITLENDMAEKSSKEPLLTGETLSLFDEKFLSEKARVKHRIIGQVFDTYWIVEYEGKMFIIDQHAAHEKVLYEKLVAKLHNNERASQTVNPPIIISLSMSEENLVKNAMNALYDIGFEIEHFGGREYAVRAVPLDLYSLNDKELLMDIIDNLENDITKLNSEVLMDRLATMACKAAVKGNNTMTYSEAKNLIDQLLELDNPYNCPHGRPTIISMTKNELEKKFKRIL